MDTQLGSMAAAEHPAKRVSMITANFGNPEAFEAVLYDWFEFLGERPGEVVVVEAGSNRQTHDLMYRLLQEGVIDTLQLIRPGHGDNSRATCFIREHNVAMMATKPYLLFWKCDTLPWRKGHDHWLAEAFVHLERPDVSAIGGSFNKDSKHHDAGPELPGYYFADHCSENFLLIKRQVFSQAMEEFAGHYIASGFVGKNPAVGCERFFIEVALEAYVKRHGQYTLTRIEDPTWTVFHTNCSGNHLMNTREKYRRRDGVEAYMNHAKVNPLVGGCYWGQPRDYVKEARVALGRWRRQILGRGGNNIAKQRA